VNVDVKDLTNEQRRSREVRLPVHDPNEREVQQRDSELGDRSRAEKNFEVVVDKFHERG
jgi:hypothetical protein